MPPPVLSSSPRWMLHVLYCDVEIGSLTSIIFKNDFLSNSSPIHTYQFPSNRRLRWALLARQTGAKDTWNPTILTLIEFSTSNIYIQQYPPINFAS
jgi:hypothetical protein